MKVVLFCGGLGLRMRDVSQDRPKPMVEIGVRPILWHLMRWYAHYGHTDFILCLGYRGDVIKRYFLEYEEWLTNDFVLRGAEPAKMELLASDLDDWRITFVDTGNETNVGQRLLAVRDLLDDDEPFFANYADGLTDAPLDEMLGFHREQGSVGTLLAVRPSATFHVVETDGPTVTRILEAHTDGLRINGGFFVFTPELFDYMRPGEELVEQPFERLIEAGRLGAYSWDGFFAAMDTAKEQQYLTSLAATGRAPWEAWKQSGSG